MNLMQFTSQSLPPVLGGFLTTVPIDLGKKTPGDKTPPAHITSMSLSHNAHFCLMHQKWTAEMSFTRRLVYSCNLKEHPLHPLESSIFRQI